MTLSYTNSNKFKGNFESFEYDVWMAEKISVGSFKFSLSNASSFKKV